MKLKERDREVIWHPFTQAHNAPDNIPVVAGEGEYLITEDGRRILDMAASWWVNLHGHAHPYIAQKLAEQARQLEHVIFAGFTHTPAVTLAERLLEILPSNLKKIFYSDNGSTAVEVALKMALQYFYNKGEQRTKIVALKNAYHGDTFGAMSVSGRSTFTDPFDALMFDVDFIEVPVPGMEKETMKQAEKLFTANDKPAAFIFEPLVQGTAGMVMYDAAPLDDLIKLAHDNGVLCIADEVMTGFGRTGRLFASDHLQQKPDLVCLSKGLTGGTLPMGITAASGKIFEAFVNEDKSHTFYHGHSYTANPLACAAALASMDLLLKDECQENIRRLSDNHHGFIKKIKGHTAVRAARVTGTIMAVELETGNASSYFSNIRDEVYNFFLDKDILVRPLGNILYLMPPYCTADEGLYRTYEAIEELLHNFAAKYGRNG